MSSNGPDTRQLCQQLVHTGIDIEYSDFDYFWVNSGKFGWRLESYLDLDNPETIPLFDIQYLTSMLLPAALKIDEFRHQNLYIWYAEGYWFAGYGGTQQHGSFRQKSPKLLDTLLKLAVALGENGKAKKKEVI